MNKKLAAFVTVLFAMACLAFSQSGFKKTKINGYELSIPSDWVTQNGNGVIKWMILSPDYMANGNLAVEELPSKMTPKEYLDATKSLLESSYEIEMIEEGNDYHIFDMTIQGVAIREIQYVQMKGKTVYITTFGTTDALFAKYLDTFKKIYSSIKF